ncbi:hypothetical protein GQ54DRAFT_259920 [Martensiomyces pterosporus]|nr:hypothetical protein GQ54DRAFT_259920 [Martensiomyces pterosporus]
MADPHATHDADVQVDEAGSVAPYTLVPLSIPRVSGLVVDAIYYNEHKLWKRQIDDVQFQLAQQDTMDDAEHGENSVIQQAMASGSNASDVIKGVYEGGLKTWECSIDLLNYLVAHSTGDSPMRLANSRVLEIGCGTALPSLHILKTEPSAKVCMQDYNKDVLELVTIPNVLANTTLQPEDGTAGDKLFTEDDTETCEIDFVAGDWTRIEEEVRRQEREHSFDLVLTSETIYESTSYRKLHDLLACVLAKPNEGGRVPMVLVAAKSIYFGLTGSVLSFSQYVRSRGVFNAETVWQSGGSMNREILCLTWA